MTSKLKPERLNAFSDGIFAVLITILVLELHPPQQPTLSALLEAWPNLLSYFVSYVFIAIVWVNHHYLLHYASEATPRLVWFNFAHMFAVSWLPLSTAWMANSELAAQPVAFYAAVFFFVNATYVLLGWELIKPAHLDAKARRNLRLRSFATLLAFAVASGLALKWPYAGLAVCCACLILYIRPDAPRAPAQS